ncbi:ATP-binding protein [Chitinophaga japonensis]|uniref:histidine kinase n=1 Tax=Chitinophaga japonensis TaxID=104662 RepID=A0A562SYP8_CHIJA|nr:ATP-binding protein [Chitinophaga japonensis]TWI86455.1 signal transduction histidine kinase [Chitinophaga japonensis]
MRVLLFLFLLLTWIFIFPDRWTLSAQPPPIDSLLHALQLHPQRDTVRVKLLNQLGRAYFTKDAVMAALYAQEAWHLGDSLQYTEGLIWATRNLALVENTKGNLDKQMDLTMNALQLAERSGQLRATGILYNDIGNIFIEQEHPEQALPYLKRSLLIKQRLHEQAESAKTLNNIGSTYMQLRKLDSALLYLRESEKLKLALHDERGLGFTYENMGLIYELQGQYAASLHYLEESLRYYTASDNLPGTGKAHLNLGKVNTLLKRYAAAATHLQKAAGINASQQNAKNEMIYYLYLARLDSSRQDYTAALQHYNQYMELKDQFFAVEKARIINNTREKYESEKKQRENQLLKKEQQTNLSTIRQQRVLVAVCSLLLLILFVITLLLYRLYRRQQELSQQLNSRNEEVSLQNRIILEQNTTLENLNQVKDKIFSVISHDLRSPLSILEGMLFLLRDRKIPAEQFRQYTDELWRDMKNTAYMMDNLLNWASSQMKGIRVKADDFEITEVFNREFELLQSLSRQKEVQLSHQLLRPVLVYADPEMIRVVLRNLINNAIKFTPAGKGIHISGQVSGAFLEICIRDEGIGIPEKDQHKVFSNIYYSTSGTQNEKGCGLGLPLSKDFVERNQGRIWFRSQPGQGTSFYFTVPLAEEEALTDTQIRGYANVQMD